MPRTDLGKMNMPHAMPRFLAAIFAMALFAAPAFAQNAQPAPAVTESHANGSWTVRCFNVSTYPCDMVQATFLRARNVRVSSIDITYIAQSDSYFGRFIVPLGISFDQGLTIQIGEFVSPHVKFRRCLRDGCYVESPLPPAMIAAMQSPDMSGKLHIVFVGGKPLDIPIALNGFAQGLSQLRQLMAQHSAGRN
jgi:invasion protein IalB